MTDLYVGEFPIDMTVAEAQEHLRSLATRTDATPDHVAALVEAARALRNDAVMLLSNAEGCAVSHYGFDAETHGMPQWLTDCRTRIVDASAALAPFTKGQNDDA